MLFEQVKRVDELRDRYEGSHFEVDEATGCWRWTRALSKYGYPFSKAYRRFWEAVNGPRPDGWHIHHKCRNTACVNPDHLEAIDPRDHRIEHWLTERGMTLDDVKEIRRLLAESDLTQEEIAARYPISSRTVWNIQEGRRWPELGGPVVRPPRKCAYRRCDRLITDGDGPRSKRYCCAAHRTNEAWWRGRDAEKEANAA
jgi:predicted DNA-binding protein (UPF0251 family)